jgi:hypothetical protein
MADLQLALDFARRPVRTADDDAAALILWLRGRSRTKAADIAAALGPDWTDRRVRAAAEAARGRVLASPGTAGYILTREATPEDRESAIRALRSQARAMIARSLAISRVHRATVPQD